MAQEDGERASTRARTAPDPEDPRKPDSLGEIEKPSWKYVARKTLREFSSDHCTDLAAALTYYATLAIFPALLAFVSIIGLIGDPEKTTKALIDVAAGVVPSSSLSPLKDIVANLANSNAAGFALVAGIAGALWSASGYVGAFSRAMNQVYSIQEGRPFWKLRPVTLLVTVLAIGVAVVIALLVALSGPIATNVGTSLGVGSTVLVVWNIVKWPIIVFLAVLVVAVLYFMTPNVQQPKFRWMSVGSLFALVVWVIASVGFAFYAANFASYNKTYGAIGGVIVFLLWIWISNIALLFGAELDAELERGRELQAGMAAEETIQLPPRDTKVSDKQAEQHRKDVDLGRRLRGAPPLKEKDSKKGAELPAKDRRQRAADEKRLKKAAAAIKSRVATQSKAIRNSGSNDRKRP